MGNKLDFKIPRIWISNCEKLTVFVFQKGSVQDRMEILSARGDKLPERQIWELFLGVCKAVKEFHGRDPPLAHRWVQCI